MGSLQNQLVSISELDELIGLATKTETVVNGSVKAAFDVPDVNIRAKVRFDSTNEAEALSQEKFTTQIKVWIRKRSVSIEQYIYRGGKYYNIYAVESTPRERFMVIKARLIEA